MTEKELLYFEDAIGHEKNIIKICDYMLENLNDEKLVSFISSEKEEHTKLKDKLLNMTYEEKLNLLSSNGMLIKRPVLVLNNKVLVGFKESEWIEGLK